MRVALIAEWLDPWRGGAETSTRQFIHHLMDHGIELHLITRSRPSPTPGMKVHTIGGASMSRTRSSVTFTHRIERFLRKQPFDIVHAISPCLSADVYQPRGGTVAETIERNVALRRHHTTRSLKRYANRFNFKQRYLLMLERIMMASGDRPVVVAISDYVVAQLRNHYDLPDERVRKIYNGVDPDESSTEERTHDRSAIREEFHIGQDDLLVLCIAHNFRLKGIERWMEALALLLRRGTTDVRSLVIGKGDAERWHRLAARLRITEHLTFTGPSDRVRAFQHAADVLVHPTYYDPCSRVVLESMASGLCCVTTRWDGASEMIEDGRSGWILHDPWDVETLADRVVSLRDQDRCQRMSLAARERTADFTMARHAVEMMSLYEELAAGRALR